MKKSHHDEEVEHIEEVESEFADLEKESDEEKEEEEYDSEIEKEEAAYIKKNNIKKKNLFDGSEED